jgi:hypothetical protein
VNASRKKEIRALRKKILGTEDHNRKEFWEIEKSIIIANERRRNIFKNMMKNNPIPFSKHVADIEKEAKKLRLERSQAIILQLERKITSLEKIYKANSTSIKLASKKI